MNSALVHGCVHHHRLTPVDHRFDYALDVLACDLADLPALDRTVGGFGYNRFRPLAIHDRDYLDSSPVALERKVRARFVEARVRTPIARIVLVTAARYWNYVFNPVSFHLAFDPRGRLCAALAEVNNTFGDRHLYVLPELAPGAADGECIATGAKVFHVSPFQDMRGDYTFTFRCTPAALHIGVDLARDGRTVFRASLAGRCEPLTTAALRRTFLRHPLRPALTIPRIIGEAIRLRFRHRLPVYTRPEPHSPFTLIRRPPGRLATGGERLVLRLLERTRHGSLTLTLPDGRIRHLGARGAAPAAALTVRRYAAYTRILLGGEVGFGEAFAAGDTESPDICRVLEFLIANRDTLADGNFAVALLQRARDRVGHLARANTRQRSRHNIFAHYDLSNAFFQTFLDPSMLYSAAYYEQPGDPLEAAQRNKLRRLLAKARLRPEHHVLEIGCGWGACAIAMARTAGCRVTAITLSTEQLKLATERVRAAGLADRITIKLCDYRDVTGRYDRIVSIEMLEAVGHRFLPAYFRRLDELLAPDGLAVLQVITIPDHRYDTYRRGCDWIQKHIFPGGHLPSLAAMADAMARHSRLSVEALENIGPHYAPTLRAWREAFVAAEPRVRALGFDEPFIRKWHYYLAYCEAAFATRTLNNLQLVLTRPCNAALDAAPAPAAQPAGAPAPAALVTA